MGQSLELMFLSPGRIERTTIREKLVELGLRLEEVRGPLDWKMWEPKGRHIKVDATVYHGIWDAYFVRLGFDNNLLRDQGVDESKNLIDEFLALECKFGTLSHSMKVNWPQKRSVPSYMDSEDM